MLREIANWTSVRKFSKDPVSREKVLAVMEAGRRAPSWKNIQPWKFIAVTQEADKLKLAEAFSMGVLIRKAPVVILCVGQLENWAKNHQRDQLRELMSAAGFNMSDEDIDKTYLDGELSKTLMVKPSSLMARTFENMGIAYGFMILEAMHQGLGACIVGELDNELVAVNDEKYQEIKKYFGLGDGEVVTAAIILGVPAGENPIKPRKPSEEIFSFFND